MKLADHITHILSLIKIYLENKHNNGRNNLNKFNNFIKLRRDIKLSEN